MEPESVRGSMLALSATAIGGGVLSLPYVCKLCGFVLGLLMLAAGYLATLWSFRLIISADIKTGGQRSIKDFCLKCGGPRLLKVYEYVVIFYLYGSLVGYQIIISNLVQGALRGFGVESRADFKTYHIIAVSLITFPMCLLKSVNSFRYATFITIGAIGYTAILLLIQMPYYWKYDTHMTLFKLDWNFFNAFGITFFAFTCQPGFYSALDKLKKRDEEHKIKVAFRSCTINLGFYVVIILTGYLSSFDDTPDIIIYRELPEPWFNIPVIIAQILIACGLCIGIPINYVPLRTAIFNQVYDNSEYSFPRTLTLTIIFSITSCLLAILLPEINTVLSVLGGIGCVTTCFIVPMTAYLTVLHERTVSCIASLILCSVLVAIGSGSCINAIYKMIGI